MEKGKLVQGMPDVVGYDSKKAEEINLVMQIEGSMKELLHAVESIEVKTDVINKNLLPKELQEESEISKDKKPPQGWLENHLIDINWALRRCERINSELTRLMQATKIEKTG